MKRIMLFCLIAVLLLSGCQLAKKQPEKSKETKGLTMEETGIAARVNNKEITREELDKRLEALYGKEILDRMIDEEIVKQTGEAQKIKITEEEIEKKLEEIKKNFPSEADFNRALSQTQMTIEELKEEIKIQITLEKLAKPKISAKEVEDFIKSSPQNKDLPKEQVEKFLKAQKISQYLEKLRSTAKIENYLEKEKKVKKESKK